jgi:hypothetical protein
VNSAGSDRIALQRFNEVEMPSIPLANLVALPGLGGNSRRLRPLIISC